MSHPCSTFHLVTSVHDGDIAPLITALNILNDSKYDPELPTTHIVPDRIWRTSSILPMGGRVTLERMACPSPEADGSGDSSGDGRRMNIFIRINVNDRIVHLPYCTSGPGGSCPLDDFLDYVRRRKTEVGDFAELCGLREDVGYISFLGQ